MNDNNLEIYKSKLENLERNIKCPCCNKYFIDSYRPYLLKCGHCICNECLKINTNYYTCLICLTKYSEKELKDLPVNYLIDEIILKLNQNKILEISNHDKLTQPKEKFYCLNCNTLMSYFSKESHLKIYPSHQLNSYEIIKNNQNDFFMKCKDKFIKTLNTKLPNEIENLSKNLINHIQRNLDNINNHDTLKFLTFLEFFSDDEIKLINYFKTLDKVDIKDENELRKFAKFDNLLNAKLMNVDNKLIEIWNSIKNQNLSQDLAEEIVNHFKNIIYQEIYDGKEILQLSYVDLDKILNEIIIYIYDYNKENLNNFRINLNDINLSNPNEISPSICQDELGNIFWACEDKLYKIDENNKNLNFICKSNFIRKQHLSYYKDFKLFLIGGNEYNNKIEYFDFIYGIWITLPDIPYHLEHPRIIFVENKLIIFDKLKRCFYLDLNDISNEFKEINLVYDYINDNLLELRNYVIFIKFQNESNFILKIIGGYFPDNIFNEEIFLFNFNLSKISKIQSDIKIKMTFQNSYGIVKNNKYILLGKNENNEIIYKLI